MCIIDRSMNV